MGIRIQPKDIEVPEDDPFQYDLLNRKESIEVVTHIIGSIEGPCVLSVDAPWGAGKTTYLRIWTQYLRNQGFPVVSFNAWETDYSEDPFVAVSSEITEQLTGLDDPDIAQRVSGLKESAGRLLARITPTFPQVASMFAQSLFSLPEESGEAIEVIRQVTETYAKGRLPNHQETRESLGDFRSSLEEMATCLSDSRQGLPVVIIIDELDRCRPTYAIELLEIAKHLFSVDLIVFVLAINRAELAHSVRAIYGNEFDASGYLRRFVDIDYKLPETERRAFVENTMNNLGFSGYFQGSSDQNKSHEYSDAKELLIDFLGSSQLSIRTISQVLHRFGLIYASLRSDRRVFGIATAVALIIRTLDLGLYARFVNGDVGDLDVADSIFRYPGLEKLRSESAGRMFDASIIVAEAEIRNQNSRRANTDGSALLDRYKKELASQIEKGSENYNSQARKVIELVDWFTSWQVQESRPPGFKSAIRRLELFSNDLMENTN